MKSKQKLRFLSLLLCAALLTALGLSGAVVPTAAENTGVVSGGDFEAASGSAVYNTNWKSLFNAGCSLVEDPLNSGNHCLMIPQVTSKKDFYLTNVTMEPATTYLIEFDVLTEVYSYCYIWPSVYEAARSDARGTQTLAANTAWTHYSYTVRTVADFTGNAAYPDYMFGFFKEDYNTSPTYIDNFSITVKPKEAPTVAQVVKGGDFEDTSLLDNNWNDLLTVGTVVEDTVRADNHCLCLPAAGVDNYLKNVNLENGCTYDVSFEARGGAAFVYFWGTTFNRKGSRSINASDTWEPYSFQVTVLEDGTVFPNYAIAFCKNTDITKVAATYIDNFRVVKAGAYVDPDITDGTLTLSSWKDTAVGAQATPAVGGTVTVTVTPNEGYMLKPGSLYCVDESGNKTQILNKESGAFGEGSGQQFRFALPQSTVVVTAEFVPTTAQNFRFATLGTSVYYGENSTQPQGVRFLNRLYLENLNVNNNTVTVTYNGKTYTVAEFGSLLKRAANKGTPLTLDKVTDASAGANRVWKAPAYTGSTMSLVDYTASYVDFTVVMTSQTVNDAFIARQYTACGYLVLKDSNNQTVTLYSDSITRSAADTAKHMVTLAEKDDSWRTHPQDYKLIAITFDGPHMTDGTGKIESVITAMSELDCSATLNVAGFSLAEGSTTRNSQITLLKEAVAKGFEIGSYTWSNDNWATGEIPLSNFTYEQLETAITDTQSIIQSTVGVTPAFVRPPYLRSDSRVVEICRKHNLSLVTGNSSWEYASGGYVTEVTGGASYDSLTGNAYDGAIWILHAHQTNTVASLLQALPDLYSQGYRFCTVSELLAYNGVNRVAGRSYAEVIE